VAKIRHNIAKVGEALALSSQLLACCCSKCHVSGHWTDDVDCEDKTADRNFAARMLLSHNKVGST
jgi:hypothetical protein